MTKLLWSFFAFGRVFLFSFLNFVGVFTLKKKNMKRKLFLLTALMWLSLMGFAQRKEVVILTLNDMHAAIENFPKLADVVDSLREQFPQLIVFSAGDNRTGNPFNDRYSDPSYPMTALMNQIGVAASAIGNHEWDNKAEGFRHQMRRSNFRYLCANMKAPDSLRLHVLPYQFFNIEGVKLGVLGTIQLGIHGIPDCHPDNVKGIGFLPANEVIPDYEWMRKECDVLALLSHDGYETDQETAKLFPWFDVILGGHTHTLVPANTFHNGVLVTQSLNKVKYATLVRIAVENGKVVSKESEVIDIAHHQGENEVVANMIDFFHQNEEMHRVLCTVERPLTDVEEIGCLMADALREESGCDVYVQNGGGVRFSEFPAGPMTVGDVLRLDPFGNESMVMEMTGQQLADFIMQCRDYDEEVPPFVSGIRYSLTINPKDKAHSQSIKLFTEDGQKLKLKRKYKVGTSNYIQTLCPLFNGEGVGATTSDLIERFLAKKGSVDYAGVHRIEVK